METWFLCSANSSQLSRVLILTSECTTTVILPPIIRQISEVPRRMTERLIEPLHSLANITLQWRKLKFSRSLSKYIQFHVLFPFLFIFIWFLTNFCISIHKFSLLPVKIDCTSAMRTLSSQKQIRNDQQRKISNSNMIWHKNTGNPVKANDSKWIELWNLGNWIETRLNRVIAGERLKGNGDFLNLHWRAVTGLYSEVLSL
jgi:hypothetical protein